MKGVGDERDLYPCKTRNEQRSCKNTCWADFGDLSDGSIVVKVRPFQHYGNLVARSAIQHIARSPYVLPVYPESHPRYPPMRSFRQLHRRTTNIQLYDVRYTVVHLLMLLVVLFSTKKIRANSEKRGSAFYHTGENIFVAFVIDKGGRAGYVACRGCGSTLIKLEVVAFVKVVVVVGTGIL